MTPKEKFCLLAVFLRRDIFTDDCEILNPKTNELVSPRQLITDIIDALDQHDKQDKILDILKKKEVCIQMLKHVLKLDKKDALEYGYNEEEYDLLKEWLND